MPKNRRGTKKPRRTRTARRPRLTVELVPGPSWQTNVRSLVRPSVWDRIRRKVYADAGQHCEVCGGQGRKSPVVCHEVWDYDDKKHVQKLLGFVALCPACHDVKHIGLAHIQGRGDPASQHLAKVNGWTAAQAERYVAAQFAVWEKRSRFSWKVDTSTLARYGVSPTE